MSGKRVSVSCVVLRGSQVVAPGSPAHWSVTPTAARRDDMGGLNSSGNSTHSIATLHVTGVALMLKRGRSDVNGFIEAFHFDLKGLYMAMAHIRH